MKKTTANADISTELFPEKVPLHHALQSLQEGIVLLDLKGTIVFINQAGRNFFEKTRGNYPAVGACYLAYVPPSRKKLTQHYLNDALSGKCSESNTCYPQGSTYSWFRLGYFPVLSSGGTVDHVCVKAQDITERVQLKKKLAAAKKALRSEVVNAVLKAQEGERLRIGRELHDNVNQVLSTVKLYLDLSIAQADQSKQLLQKSIQRLGYAMDEIRNLSHDLSSSALTGVELTVQLKELCDSLAATEQLTVQFLSDGVEEKALSQEIKTALYRVAQQQFANILKHSRARMIELIVVGSYEGIALRITDNGRGADLARIKKGIGFISMRSRVEALGGRLQLKSSPGKGFHLMVELPLK